MRVRFTKVDAKRYQVAIEREHGPTLVPRFGPGNDDLMPHDLAHFIVEEYFRIRLGVWGQLAAGGTGIFTPAPEDNSLAYQRRGHRLDAVGHQDMARSEQLVVVTVAAWERSINRSKHRTCEIPVDIDEHELEGAVRRMGEVAVRWKALPHAGSLSLVWPKELIFNGAGSRRGRRQPKRALVRPRR